MLYSVLFEKTTRADSPFGLTLRDTCQRLGDPAPGVDASAEGLVTVRDDLCNSLELEIAGTTLRSCLEHFVKEERMNDPKSLLDFGKLKVPGCMFLEIATLPDTLVLSIKRFEFNKRLQRKAKLDAPVEIPEELDLSPYCVEAPPCGSVRDPRAYRYELSGMGGAHRHCRRRSLLGVRA